MQILRIFAKLLQRPSAAEGVRVSEQPKHKHRMVEGYTAGATAEVWSYREGRNRECHVEIKMADGKRAQVVFTVQDRKPKR